MPPFLAPEAAPSPLSPFAPVPVPLRFLRARFPVPAPLRGSGSGSLRAFGSRWSCPWSALRSGLRPLGRGAA